MSDNVRNYDLGTWGFLKTGWWVLHVVGIALFIYIGYWWASSAAR